MSEKISTKNVGGITLLGLGPGATGALTQEAWAWLKSIDKLLLRTVHHPVVSELPETLAVKSFDHLYETGQQLEAVYETIITEVLTKGEQPGGVTYAVPGHPFVLEATCPEIARRAKAAGIPVRVIDGLSFLEPICRALDIDPFSGLVLVDAMDLAQRLTIGFSATAPALVGQIYSKQVAAAVKLALMSAYDDDHPVKLVHGTGTEKLQVETMPLLQIDRSPNYGLLSSLYVPPLSNNASMEAFQEIIARLRAPDGCPWDREQTHLSLRPFLLEEAYETLDALDRGDLPALQEELGDLLLQIVLHAQIANEAGNFNLQGVIEGIGNKLIRRHPHVFSEVKVDGVSGVTRNWEAIKAAEREENGSHERKGLLDGIPKALPALIQADQVIERVSRVAFDHLEQQGDLGYLQVLFKQLESSPDAQHADLIGTLLLGLTSYAHQAGVDAESALRNALSRFRKQFGEMEARALAAGQTLGALSAAEKDKLWAEAGRQYTGDES